MHTRASSARALTVLSGLLIVLTATACRPRNEIKLTMERTEVVGTPLIRSLSIDPRGELDTRDRERQVRVVLEGDPGLMASFDVVGPRPLERQPMGETAPGMYEGSFDVHRGETGEVEVVGHLVDPASAAHQQARVEDAVRLFQSGAPQQDCPPVAAGVSCTALDQRLQPLAIYFDFNQAELRDDSAALLRGLASVLALNPPCPLKIHGHADDVGTPDYNVELSRRRALVVATYLESQGIPGVTIETFAHGESFPLESGESSELRDRNRRVEIRTTNPY